jgi:hypothetical protein
MIEIPLTQGCVALIDECDADKVLQFNWTVSVNKKRQLAYVRRNVTVRGKTRSVFLHRFLLDPPPHLEVDHINGNGLDNRRSNLRLATPAENRRNAKLFANNTTGYKGVRRYSKGRWYAEIKAESKPIRLGIFDSKEIAARAYDKAAVEHFGEFARLNFPDSYDPNFVPPQRVTSSKYIGVAWSKFAKCWRADVSIKKRSMWRKYFKNETEAAQARDLKAIEFQGKKAKLNFPM